jgi:hypothetical protein
MIAREKMTNFWDLFKQSVILSGFITVLCIGCLCFLAVTGRPIPEVLVNICLIVVSFFFGTKATSVEARARARSYPPE